MTAQPGAQGGPEGADGALPHITLVSFGFKHGAPPLDPAGHGGFLFDCRALPNPFWEEELRAFSGREARIQDWMGQHAEVETFLQHVLGLVRYTAATYRRMERPSLFISLGCTGGYHRSVFVAERVADALRSEGFALTLQHRDVTNQHANKPM